MGLFGILDTGRSGLMASQKGLHVAGNNLANIATPGYTRQRLVLETSPSIRMGQHLLGSGVQVRAVQQMRNQFLEDQLVVVRSDTGFHSARQFPLGQMENLLHETDAVGLNRALDQFFNSMRDLSVESPSVARRSAVRETADQVINEFKRVATGLTKLQQITDQDLAETCREVSRLAQEIATLNKQIVSVEAGELGSANELRDKRGQALSLLSEHVAVNTFEDRYGRIAVMVGGGKPLVEGNQAGSMSMISTPDKAQILFHDAKGNEVDVTDSLSSGRIAGMLNARDGELADILDRVNHVAFSFVQELNAIHRNGVGLDGVGGRDFFVPLAQEKGAAANMAISADIEAHLDAIAAGLDAGALPGDNRNALAMADLQLTQVIDGTLTYGNFIGRILGDVGARVRANDSGMEFNGHSLMQLEHLRESFSGVSSDEEMLDLIRFQSAFAASARVISVVNEMLDSVLSMVR